jgi:COP9 signalosome complex subunit 3
MAAELLNILLGFQPDGPELQQRREYDKAAREFVSNISNITPSHYLKGVDTTNDALSVCGHGLLLVDFSADDEQVLDPTTNSIAYAVTLRIRIGAAIERKSLDQLRPGNLLWNKLVLFLESFDPVQMRYAGHEWRKLIDYVEQIARATGTVRIQREV